MMLTVIETLTSVLMLAQDPPKPPVEFVNSQSILTLGGAAVAVAAVANTLRQVFKLEPLKTAFITSMILALLRVVVSMPVHWSEWPLAFVNGCILFCTAIGMNEWTVTPRSKLNRKGPAASPEAPQPRESLSWFNR